MEYISLLILAYLVPVAYWVIQGGSALVMLPILTLPLAWINVRSLLASVDGPALNATLARTAGLQLLYAGLFTLGLLV